MGAGFYKFRESDVEGLTLMLSHIQGQTFDKRCRMVLVCLANTWEDESRAPCPFFSLGARTLAERTGESYKSARTFLDKMERDGWFVRLGTERNKSGEWTLRTFFWMNEGAPIDEEKRAHRVRPKRGAPPKESPAKRGAPVRPKGSQNRRSESWAGRTSELTEVSSDKGVPPADAGARPVLVRTPIGLVNVETGLVVDEGSDGE